MIVREQTQSDLHATEYSDNSSLIQTCRGMHHDGAATLACLHLGSIDSDSEGGKERQQCWAVGIYHDVAHIAPC